MTNIFKSPEKHDRKKRLFQIGVQTLEKEGWTVTKEKLGKSSVRRVSKNGDSKLVSIRTTQDTWLAFPPKPNGTGWFTLDDVEVVVAVSVAGNPPREALVHWLPADEMRKRYDLAYQARKEAKRVFPKRRGVWIPMYERESDNPENVSYVGGGAGLDHPPIARVPLNAGGGGTPPSGSGGSQDHGDNGRFTIADAKRLLSSSLDVPESSIKITIEA
jgi:hypothetical protein